MKRTVFLALLCLTLTLLLTGCASNADTQPSPSVGMTTPMTSPNVTNMPSATNNMDGVLGSMLAGCVLTLVYSLLSVHYNVLSIGVQPRHYLVLLGMGAVASVLGILGDLFASSVKRQVGIKDYGTIFPGHGGILDRFDSVMFIAPFVSIAVRYFFYLL